MIAESDSRLRKHVQLWLREIINELSKVDSFTTTSLMIFACTMGLVALISAYYFWRFVRVKAQTDAFLEKLNEMLRAKEERQETMLYILRLARETGDSMNKALYMAEMNRNAKESRDRGPLEVYDRATRLWTERRTRRCPEDRVALHSIDEHDEMSEESLGNLQPKGIGLPTDSLENMTRMRSNAKQSSVTTKKRTRI